MRKIVLFWLIGFLFFIPFGSMPIYIGEGLKLDNIIGFLLFIVLAIYILFGARLFSPDWSVLVGVTFYFIVATLSTLLSLEPIYSLGRFIVIGGYAFVALSVPYIFMDRLRFLGCVMISFASMSAFVIWVSYFVLGMSSWGRMTIPTYTSYGFKYFPEGWGSSADPNILGFGLVLSCLFFIATQDRLRVFHLMLIVFTFSAAMLALSRTVMVSLLVAFGCSVILLFLVRMAMYPEALKIKYRLSAKLVLTAVFGIITILVFPFDALAQRIMQHSMARIDLIRYAINVWLQNDKTILFGVGFDMARATRDPHNIYLTALHDMGLIGLLALLGLFACILHVILKIKISRIRFWALVIFFYISTAGLSYWHTKTLWVSLMFCLLLASYDRYTRLKSKIANSTF